MFSKYSAVNKAITPPNLYPLHQPTTAIAAPAAIDLFSFSPICSILKASTVISCVAEAIAMVKVPEEQKQNKKSIMPQIDYGKCVFCGLCVDACPFYALYMTNDYELSSFSKEGLIYTPAQLAVKPYVEQDSEIVITKNGATHG